MQDILKHYDELGGPTTYPHYAAGWAVAGDTPFTWTKQVASSYGGTRNGMVIHWPELKEMKKTDRDDAEQARKAAALRKGLAD